MSNYYSPQTQYNAYQSQYPAYSNTTNQSYPAQYPPQTAQISGTSGQYAYSTPGASNNPGPPESSPPAELPAAPELSDVSPKIASQAIQQLISHELRHAGFDSAQPSALERLEIETIAFIKVLFQFAHDCADQGNRTHAIATDLMMACEEFGLTTNSLHEVEVASRKRKEEGLQLEVVELIPAPSRSPSPELLESDDEGITPSIPATLRAHPHYLPTLPPKHTYLQTPASPPKKAGLTSLEKKLKNAGLVQESLRNLLLATEENTGQEDGELLGAIVNWEAATQPRKRWKVRG